MCVGVCHCNNAMPVKPFNHYQLFSTSCGRGERSAEGKFDTKEDVGITD